MLELEPELELVREFEVQRPRLRAVAFRILGSFVEADDAVQETWIRLSRSDASAIDNLTGWLTTVVRRICLDLLRKRRIRDEAAFGVHVPEPLLSPTEGFGPEDEAILADSVGQALLVVLDVLTPAERLAFVLHDMFRVPFDQIARIVAKSPDATRVLASRARRRARGAVPGPASPLEREREVVAAFSSAARGGDLATLIRVLAPDVAFRAQSTVAAGSGGLKVSGA